MAGIGIIDSGLGGLTVWQAIRERCPGLACLYLADQQHLPYGPREQAEIQRLCAGMTIALRQAGCRLIVLACNTASAAALKTLRERFPDIPFVGMEPAVKPAALQTRTGVVGLMATRGTLKGELLQQTAARFAGHVEIVSSDCPGLAEAIESGLSGEPLYRLLRGHVADMQRRGADTIVLGCTHYPLILPVLEEVFGPDVRLIDPAPAVARQVERLWHELGPTSAAGEPDRFVSTAAQPDSLRRILETRFAVQAPVESWCWEGDMLRPCTTTDDTAPV